MDIIGHRHLLANLSHLYSKDNMPQSIMFVGTDGVGKFSIAVWYASLLNCQSPVIGDFSMPCGSCISCRKIKSGNHPDIKIIVPDEKTFNIKIEQTRDLGQEAAYLPLEGKFKIFIVKDAHRMLDGAASAYLKLLEEPPLHMVHILTCVNINLMLPTIVSRCTPIRFFPLDRKSIISFLIENKGISENQAAIFADISQGSLGRALSLIEDEKFMTARNSLFDILSVLNRIDQAELSVRADGLLSGDFDGNALFELIILWIRDLASVKGGMPVSFLVNSDYSSALKKQSESVSMNQILSAYDLIDYAGAQFSYQVSPALILDRLIKYMAIAIKN